ncbi:MAG: peroxidase-related enzyme [Alphaproteobacteria bacterium]|nr:peroxidase-related enzyme [Alphaproteobacteria bacterium]
MPRIAPVSTDTAAPEAANLLSAVKQKLGLVPNLYATVAHSPKALAGLLQLTESLGAGALSAKTRERIALAVAERNGCDYCLSAHTALGKRAGLSEAEIHSARVGRSAEPKEGAAIAFARALVEARGGVSAQDVAAIRNAGFSDEQIVEIIANVALNIFTNYLNEALDVVIDFPRAPALNAA